jgi:hypothetical protein
MQITLKLRLRDKHASGLRKQARAVNYVWNFANETQKKAAQARRKWLTYVDPARLTAGAGKELDLHAHTIQRVCRAYDDARKIQKKAWLRWRGRKSLGWVADAIRLMDVYFLQQAKRVRQTATVGDAEADARAVLAILRERDWRDCSTGRQLQRVASGRLANSRNRKDACAILVEAGLLYWKPETSTCTMPEMICRSSFRSGPG